uniref:Subtilisin-like protease fibronectin type-III domain-containing protein n=1 Tax=Kalanchoe fedtschenkoi TaxID=63787 RepID=A0A7N0U7Z6_KALFE
MVIEDDRLFELAYGAGQISPVSAVDPGLIYDIDENDYLKYICGWSKFNETTVLSITRDASFNCSKVNPLENNWSLNLPTFSIPYASEVPFFKVYTRTVTNVGEEMRTTYKAVVAAPKGIKIKVFPRFLAFNKKRQKLSYTIGILGILSGNSTVHSASVVWTNGKYHVRSPIVVFPKFDRHTVEETILDPRNQDQSSSILKMM